MIFGQDTFGNDFIADLAKMPHLLIAGSTGSGKSVALNAMLVSLLCSLKPSELQLIIIDPKRLEFAAYDGIAHLVFPIVTDTKKAIPILKWVVQTMEKRYEIMAKFGVRNLGDYKIAALKNKEMEPMPFMVGIIDELADLMMTAGKAVEDSIARIAQMARAAGIHMIIATQRPSVDVITGMIKVNLPNRVAFKVTSKIDSRTILDAGGAEKLLGRGDMLFLDASKSHLVRVHGAYISDQEIHDVVAQIKKQSKVHYLDIFEQFNNNDSNDLFDGDDELYQEIVQFIQELDEVSISMLQRRFRIGYNRSARLISILESKGLIMTVDGGKTRRVVK
jgi:S-DNA-T family DNA segregation ATPase FtsK/SpoIIIE